MPLSGDGTFTPSTVVLVRRGSVPRTCTYRPSLRRGRNYNIMRPLAFDPQALRKHLRRPAGFAVFPAAQSGAIAAGRNKRRGSGESGPERPKFAGSSIHHDGQKPLVLFA